MHAIRLLILAISFSQSNDNQPPPAIVQFTNQTTFYYLKPDPALGPKMLSELVKKENIEHPYFEKHQHTLGILAAQLGDIANGKPSTVRDYEAAFASAPPAGRRLIIRALTICGDKDTIKQTDLWLADPKYADVKGDLASLKKQIEDAKRKHVRDRAAQTPDDLDLLWANFFITGEYAPISRILDVLDPMDSQENVVMKRVAHWSFASNLMQHPKLVDLVREHLKERPEPSRKAIESLLRTLDQLPGKWISQDADKNPLEFGKDGTFKCGFIKNDKDNWVIASGSYSILADGKISTKAEANGSTLYQTFTLSEGVLKGSRGPNPKVEWKKEVPSP